MTMLVADIPTRDQFGQLLIERDLRSEAVEVGTHRGHFARVLLDTWPGKLHCIDPWTNPEDYIVQSAYLEGGGQDRERDFDICTNRLGYFIDKGLAVIHRCLSADACRMFKDNSLDLAYIDGNHEPPHVLNDLQNWWPKVRPGGLLAGHDVVCPGEPQGGWGQYVQPALFGFAEKHDRHIYLVVEGHGLPWSFYIVK